MNYDDIQPGDDVIITSRGNVPATVVRKFKSTSADTLNNVPAGTEYVELKWGKRAGGFNYPHQLEPR